MKCPTIIRQKIGILIVVTTTNERYFKLADMGNNARRLAEKEFDRDKLARQALEVVEKVMDT